MTIKLYYFTAAPNVRLHLAVRSEFNPQSLSWLLGPLQDANAELSLQRGQCVEGIDTHVVLNALGENGWAVLGSGFRLAA